MDFIYDGFSMLLTHMETHTYGENSRVDYLKKLIKYIEMDSDNEFLSLSYYVRCHHFIHFL